MCANFVCISIAVPSIAERQCMQRYSAWTKGRKIASTHAVRNSGGGAGNVMAAGEKGMMAW